MKSLVYWTLSGVGGIQRFDALLSRALLDLGVETHILAPSSMNVRQVEVYHGVSLEGAHFISYGALGCGGPYCSLANNLHGNLVLTSITDKYDLVFIDTAFLSPAGGKLVKQENYIYYIHGAITTRRPRPIVTFKPHRLLLHGIISMGSDFRPLLSSGRVYANSLFTAMLSRDAIGYVPNVL